MWNIYFAILSVSIHYRYMSPNEWQQDGDDFLEFALVVSIVLYGFICVQAENDILQESKEMNLIILSSTVAAAAAA